MAEVLLQSLDLLKRAHHHGIPEMASSIREVLFRQQPSPGAPGVSPVISKLTIVYFLVYTLLGVLLHCNFYPWT